MESLFSFPLAVFPDPAHSRQEERFKAIGRTAHGRAVLIVFTLRKRGDAIVIRPISAPYMDLKEVAHYETETARAAQRQGG